MEEDLGNSLFQASTYREVVKFFLSDSDGRKRHGAAKALDESLKCHSTFVSHVLAGKADFSNEQSLRFCAHFSVDPDGVDYFMDLVNRDKAGDKPTQLFFEQRLASKKAERLNIKKRLKTGTILTAEQEDIYYRSWLVQAVHVYCQLPGTHKAKSIADELGVERDLVERALKDLVRLNVVGKSDGGYRSLKDSVHLGKESSAISKSHYNWRLKATQDLMNSSPQLPGLHYSSVASMSDQTAAEVRELILQHIQKTRAKILPSPPDELHVFCLDFYRLARPSNK